MMKKSNVIKGVVIIGFAVFLAFTFLQNAGSSAEDISLNIGAIEKGLYEDYKTNYLLSSGAIKSNVNPVGWCPNEGIGCDDETTSEAVARLSRYAVLSGDKTTLDKEIKFYYDYMKHPEGDYMMWKLESNLQPSKNGDGIAVSAVDAELIMVEALLDADKLWDKDSQGIKYTDTAKIIMDSLKGAVFDEKYISFCMYYQNGKNNPCEKRVFLGYINLVTLKKMCEVDSYWCGVYESSKVMMLGAVKDNGVYSVYTPESGQYSTYLKSNGGYQYENAPIHTNWALKNLLADEATSYMVKSKYNQSRTLFLSNKQLCQEFNPVTKVGCIPNVPSLFVYTDYLEMASKMNDKVFADALFDFIYTNRMVYDKPQDQYSTISTFESFGYARRAFGRME